MPDHYHNTLGPHEPVLRLAAGDTVVTTTADAWGFDARREQVAARSNPQTGPFYVEGAEPGDTLVLRLDRLAPNRSHGFSSAQIAPNVVDPAFVPELPRLPNGQRPEAEWYVDVAAGTATLVAPETTLGRLTLPLAPMLGCFGVAPAAGQAISTATSGPHGGNMDYRGFDPGVTVYLPVFVPGALIFVGDGHAVQGDGEIVGTGIEISFDVQFTVEPAQGQAHRLAAGRERHPHLHRRQRPAARPGGTARDDRDASLAAGGLWPGPGRRQYPDGAVRRVRSGQHVRSGVHDGVQDGETVPARQMTIIEVNGARLEYVEMGVGDPLVFVHGSLGDLRIWRRQVKLFSARYRVIAYSRRYHHPNAAPGEGDPEYTAALHADDLARLIEKLNLGPAHLVTSSFGGCVALALAVTRPELVRSLVLAEPPLMPWLEHIPGGAPLAQAFYAEAWRPRNGPSRKAIPSRAFVCSWMV